MTLTIRQRMEAARDYAKIAMEGERSGHPIGGVFDHCTAALKILDEATREEWGKGEGSDQYVFVLDPERIAH